MKIESLKIAIDGDDLATALKCIKMPQNIRICGARFEPEELVIDLSMMAPIRLQPSFHVSVIQAAGSTVALQISAPSMAGLIDLFMSSAASVLPNGLSYLGRGIIVLDIPAMSNGTVTSINIGGIQFEEGRATISVHEIDLDISAIVS